MREHLDGNLLAGVICWCGKNILLNPLFNLARVKDLPYPSHLKPTSISIFKSTNFSMVLSGLTIASPAQHAVLSLDVFDNVQSPYLMCKWDNYSLH